MLKALVALVLLFGFIFTVSVLPSVVAATQAMKGTL